MSNTRHAFTKSILHAFPEILHSTLPSHLLNKNGGWAVSPTTLFKLPQKTGQSVLKRVAPVTLIKLPQSGQSALETLSINKKTVT